MAEKQWVRTPNTTREGITNPRVYGGRAGRIGAPLVEQWNQQGIEWREVDPLAEEGGRTVEELQAAGFIGIELLRDVEPVSATE